MNSGQRCQLNFLEQLPLAVTCALISGIHYPFLTFLLELTYAIGRIVYAYGYMEAPGKRVAGVVMGTLSLLIMLVLAYKTGYDML